MTSLRILGSRVAICIAPGSKNGMYLRRVNVKNTPAQKKARLEVTKIAIAHRGESPEAVRAAVATGMAGKNFGGKSPNELKAIRYKKADASAIRQAASLRV